MVMAVWVERYSMHYRYLIVLYCSILFHVPGWTVVDVLWKMFCRIAFDSLTIENHVRIDGARNSNTRQPDFHRYFYTILDIYNHQHTKFYKLENAIILLSKL